jgi:hypothetical protein
VETRTFRGQFPFRLSTTNSTATITPAPPAVTEM